MHNIVQRLLAANILLMYKWNHAFLLIVFALAWKWQIFIKKQTWWFTDKAIIELGCLADKWFAPLATDKSRYFAQPRPIIVNYSYVCNRLNTSNVDTFQSCRRAPQRDSSLIVQMIIKELLLLLRTIMRINTFTVKIRNYEAAYCFFRFLFVCLFVFWLLHLFIYFLTSY